VDPQAVLLVSCADQVGIVAAISSFVHEHGGNIIDLQQHTDRSVGWFFQRVQYELAGFDLDRQAILPTMAPLLERFAIRAEVRFTDEPPKTSIFVSAEPHCLQELLSRWRAGELKIDLRSVISNHADHADLVAWFGVPYHWLPVSRDTKALQERQVAAVLAADGVELIVLARYMQILSPEFVAPWEGRAINIHHSFLPAFQGARPYHQAHDRGVKLIGVTAHYVTAALDEGPIIDQDVVRISHRDDTEALRRKGRDLEVAVLARALRAHLEHRVLVQGRRTIVFDD
jgi:formyltetrahydrofolate deformylase